LFEILVISKLKTVFGVFGDVSLSHEFKGRHGVDHKSGGASRSVKNRIK